MSTAGPTFEEWLLIGILFYVLLVVILIAVRHLAVKRALCPDSRCHVHCLEMSPDFRRCWCGSGPSTATAFCCRRRHSLYMAPACRFRCHAPRFDYFSCVCCEFYAGDDQEDEGKGDEIKIESSLDDSV